MRGEPLKQIMLLINLLQEGSWDTEQMAQKLGCSRRSIERHLKILGNTGFILKQEQRGKRKYWSIPPSTDTWASQLELSLDELSELQTAIGLVESRNPASALQLRSLFHKLLKHSKTSYEVDLDALREAETLALGPRPNRQVSPETLAELRHSILAQVYIHFDYRKRHSKKYEEYREELAPYGLLYSGLKNFLVGQVPDRGLRCYDLANISKLQLSEEFFEPDPDFDLQEYSQRSFGGFIGEVLPVVWRFLPAVAQQAAKFQFHPQQEQEWQEDGSLIVRFAASGEIQMCHHLFTWGSQVQILEPESLQNYYTAMLDEAYESIP